MSQTFYDEVQEMRARYPDPLSAVLPALQLAQDRHDGWLPEAALREVAEALDLTPAYCLSIASFYDMFHTEPVGRHSVEVCTNVSCAVSGAQQVWRRSSASSGSASARRPRTVTSRSAPWSASAAVAGQPSSLWTTDIIARRRADVPRIVKEFGE